MVVVSLISVGPDQVTGSWSGLPPISSVLCSVFMELRDKHQVLLEDRDQWEGRK